MLENKQSEIDGILSTRREEGKEKESVDLTFISTYRKTKSTQIGILLNIDEIIVGKP